MAPPADVAAQLADEPTRDKALAKLERHTGPHAAELSLAVAPALGKLLVADAAEVDAPMARRVGLLPTGVVGGAGGGGRSGCGRGACARPTARGREGSPYGR